MPDSSLTLQFRRGDASADDLQTEVDAIVAELSDPTSPTADLARQAGLDPGELAGARVEVTEDGQGLEPVLTSILVGIAISAGGKVAESFWKDVLWPRLRRRLGVTALDEPVGGAVAKAE